jgi:hypothetical protein
MVPLRSFLAIILLCIPGTTATVDHSVVLCGGSVCTTAVPNQSDPILNFTGSFTEGGETLTLSGKSEVRVTPLSLQFLAESYYSLTGASNAWSQSNVAGRIQDSITINDAARNGETGYLSMSFLVTGDESINGLANLVRYGAGGAQQDSHWVTGGTYVDFSDFQFTYGQPFDLSIAFSSSLFFGPGVPLTGFADYYNTAVLTRFVPLLSDGDTLNSTATVSAASGVDYLAATAIPEPATLVLIALGAASIIVMRSRRS